MTWLTQQSVTPEIHGPPARRRRELANIRLRGVDSSLSSKQSEEETP